MFASRRNADIAKAHRVITTDDDKARSSRRGQRRHRGITTPSAPAPGNITVTCSGHPTLFWRGQQRTIELNRWGK
jgi:hypothetical protein